MYSDTKILTNEPAKKRDTGKKGKKTKKNLSLETIFVVVDIVSVNSLTKIFEDYDAAVNRKQHVKYLCCLAFPGS